MKIVAIVGSISKESVNMKLANYMKEEFKSLMDLEILDLKPLPMFSVDIENNPPEVILSYREKIRNADGIIIITPEYNSSIPGVLKNALDWFSRVDFVLKDKPMMIMGSSLGRFGSLRAQLHLREILETPFMKPKLYSSGDICLGSIHTLLDEEGNLVHKDTEKFLEAKIQGFVNWIK